MPNQDLPPPSLTSPKRSKAWLMVCGGAVSLALHLALFAWFSLLVPAKKPEMLSVWLTSPPKQPAQQPLQDKMVIAQAVATERPKEARNLAEFDHQTKRETQAKKTSFKASSAAKKPIHSVLKKTGDAKDPLNIRLKPQNLHLHSDADYREDVKEGEETQLNAWQWRHATFFNRIKNQIASHWSPNAQITRHDPQGALIGNQNRMTVVDVTINKAGNITELRIAKESGVAYLDEEAERALRSAAPFAYPPQELFLENDEFSFSFSFHLQVNRSFSLDFSF